MVAQFSAGHRRRSAAASSQNRKSGCRDLLIACVGGGSNAIGLFYPFLQDDTSVKMVKASKPAAHGILPETARRAVPGRFARRFARHNSYILQDENGQIQLTHSVSAGLDYAASARTPPGSATPTVSYTYATDDKALEAFQKLARASKASSRRWSPPTRSPKSSNARQK